MPIGIWWSTAYQTAVLTSRKHNLTYDSIHSAVRNKKRDEARKCYSIAAVSPLMTVCMRISFLCSVMMPCFSLSVSDSSCTFRDIILAFSFCKLRM